MAVKRIRNKSFIDCFLLERNSKLIGYKNIKLGNKRAPILVYFKKSSVNSKNSLGFSA